MANGNPFFIDPTGGRDVRQAFGVDQFINQIGQQNRQAEASDAIRSALESGDPNVINETAIRFPGLSQLLFEQVNIRDENQKREAADFSRQLLTASPERRSEIFQRRISSLQQQGRDPSQTIQSFQDFQEDPEGEIRNIEGFFAGAAPNEFRAFDRERAEGRRTASQREFDDLTEGLSPEDQDQARRFRLGLVARPSNRENIDDAARRAAEIEGSKKTATGITQRQQAFIDAGIPAADSTAVTRRGLELLDQVDTGGIDAVAIRAKQLFGIEGADEAELSNNLAKAVLSQLRTTFGAAFTAKEGEQLQRIEAGIGKSPAGNKRILQQLLKISERSARRAINAAKKAGDDFTVKEIEDALQFSLNPNVEQQQTDAVESAPGGFTEVSDEDLLSF